MECKYFLPKDMFSLVEFNDAFNTIRLCQLPKDNTSVHKQVSQEGAYDQMGVQMTSD